MNTVAKALCSQPVPPRAESSRWAAGCQLGGVPRAIGSAPSAAGDSAAHFPQPVGKATKRKRPAAAEAPVPLCSAGMGSPNCGQAGWFQISWLGTSAVNAYSKLQRWPFKNTLLPFTAQSETPWVPTRSSQYCQQ